MGSISKIHILVFWGMAFLIATPCLVSAQTADLSDTIIRANLTVGWDYTTSPHILAIQEAGSREKINPAACNATRGVPYQKTVDGLKIDYQGNGYPVFISCSKEGDEKFFIIDQCTNNISFSTLRYNNSRYLDQYASVVDCNASGRDVTLLVQRLKDTLTSDSDGVLVYASRESPPKNVEKRFVRQVDITGMGCPTDQCLYESQPTSCHLDWVAWAMVSNNMPVMLIHCKEQDMADVLSDCSSFNGPADDGGSYAWGERCKKAPPHYIDSFRCTSDSICGSGKCDARAGVCLSQCQTSSEWGDDVLQCMLSEINTKEQSVNLQINASGGCAQDMDCPNGKICDQNSNICIQFNPFNQIHLPTDTPCTASWPSRQGSVVNINEPVNSCDLFEVADPSVLAIAKEAAACHQNQCAGACHSSCSLAMNQSRLYAYPPDQFKVFAAFYYIYGLGPSWQWMQHYFQAEINCNPAASGPSLGLLGGCAPKTNLSDAVQPLECKDAVGQPKGWANDSNMSKNSCIFSDLPAHASLSVLHTGTCVDYSVALTTLLRVAGFPKNDVFSVTAPGHEYNLLRLPYATHWNIVDTVGNSPNPIGDTWSWKNGGKMYNHCDYNLNSCSNDAGTGACPAKAEVVGCENYS